MKQLTIGLTLLAVVCLAVSAQGQTGNVELDNLAEVTFLHPDDGMRYWYAGMPLTLEIRFDVGPDNVYSIGNGLEFGSETGGTFSPLSAFEALPASEIDTMFDLGHSVNAAFGIDGVGYDTVKTYGAVLIEDGIDANWSGIWAHIETGALEEGHEYCLDSCYYPPSGTWLWRPTGAPTWGGGPIAMRPGGAVRYGVMSPSMVRAPTSQIWCIW